MTDGESLRIRFTGADLPRVRQRVGAAAAAAGLDENRCEELVLAVYELACNAILHGGGGGRLLLSRVEGSVRCQVSDDGPGFGDVAAPGGGLWLAGQLSDRMEIDGGAGHGAVVTLLVRCRSNAAG